MLSHPGPRANDKKAVALTFSFEIVEGTLFFWRQLGYMCLAHSAPGCLKFV
jgi:hypothetical protein